jgi:hypothetical protein
VKSQGLIINEDDDFPLVSQSHNASVLILTLVTLFISFLRSDLVAHQRGIALTFHSPTEDSFNGKSEIRIRLR